MSIFLKRAILFIVFIGISMTVAAHGIHGSGIMAGISHPILGIDHLLAILAMALYTKLKFDDKTWYIIFSFIGMMIVGGLIGIEGDPYIYEESIILGSVILYGLFIGLDFKIPLVVYVIIGGLIGFYHGHAHGVEMPDTTTTIKYVPGFAFGALIISAFGEFIGRHMAKDSIYIVRFLGGCIVGVGIMKLFS